MMQLSDLFLLYIAVQFSDQKDDSARGVHRMILVDLEYELVLM